MTHDAGTDDVSDVGGDTCTPGNCDVGAEDIADIAVVPEDVSDVTGQTCEPEGCDAPPANSCVDESTLRSFASRGTCVEGVCVYADEDLDCPDGCLDGACVGDPCAGVICDTPPAAVCVDAATRRVYATTGTCDAAGDCAYEGADETCANGCVEGACQADPCDGLVCDSPPAPVCIDGTVLRSPVGEGTCDAGDCTYETMDVACDNGCADGACVPWVASQVATGAAHACAIVTGGRVVCWGDNRRGQAGEAAPDGQPQAMVPPRRAGFVGGPEFDGVTYLAAGESHTCAVRDRTVHCWGDNTSNQLGRTTALDFDPNPAPVDNRIGTSLYWFARRVSAGRGHTCIAGSVEQRFASGTNIFPDRVVCWGDDARGQVGQFEPSATPRMPSQVQDGGSTAPLDANGMLFSGDDHTCVFGNRQRSGLTYYFLSCWGASDAGQSGDRAELPYKARVVTETTAAGRFRVLSAKGQTTCYTQRSGNPLRFEVVCLGDVPANGGFSTSSPTLVAPWQDAIDLAVGHRALCVVREGGAVECLGDVDVGLDLSTPTPITGFAGEASWLAAGDGFACALDGADGTVRCWGDNTLGQLGRTGAGAWTTASQVAE